MKKAEGLNPKKIPNRSSDISLSTPVQYLKGVGPARSRLLSRLGINTIEDIIYYFPWRYEDRRNLNEIASLVCGEHETTLGEIVSAEVVTTPRRRMKIVEVVVRDKTGMLKCKWFNQPFLKRYFKREEKVVISGIVKAGLFGISGLEMENPDFELLTNEDRLIHTSRIIPVYKATEGISPKQIRTLIFNVINNYYDLVKEYLPQKIINKNRLKHIQWAVREMHFPEEFTDIEALNKAESPGHRRFAFDEFFLLELGLALMKNRETIEHGISFRSSKVLVERFMKGLDFKLTGAQERVISEIGSDMQRSSPMNRLIHGDVGCGKTVVAVGAMLIAVENGYQACLMAPTEILAEQHFANINRMLEKLDVNVLLLTSGTGKEKLSDISEGDVQIIIGTHALIQEHVRFKALGIAIIDEQHKFGVVQRADLRHKGFNPDILIMTATPIPRTLALTLYGDLDISIIDELPSGRKPVKTMLFFPGQKDKVYSLINSELSKGRQVYVVYPLIEGSEKVDLKSAVEGAEAFKKKFPQKRVELVHGKIRQDERERIMADFKSGSINILVATTVIEVGVDVSNASLMLVVHSERFGLAQLHQLRGRIGRGSYESYCLLMAYPPLSEDAKRRLKAMEYTSDGFRIAEEDLSIRGHGEFFGTRQSGIPDLNVANIVRDVDILEAARREAFDLADVDPELKKYPELKKRLRKKWMGRLELIKS